jgi:hypothetical protein
VCLRCYYRFSFVAAVLRRFRSTLFQSTSPFQLPSFDLRTMETLLGTGRRDCIGCLIGYFNRLERSNDDQDREVVCGEILDDRIGSFRSILTIKKLNVKFRHNCEELFIFQCVCNSNLDFAPLIELSPNRFNNDGGREGGGG